jgi:hypothetical protein
LATVLDTRTADDPRYVVEVLRQSANDAQAAGILTLPANASWATLASALQTLSATEWPNPTRRVLLFFDQFENVFRDEHLTRTFRDLAIGVRELDRPILVGFAWKTDLVGWIEGHPYQLRDDIRDSGVVIRVEPFGPSEVSVLLGRLEREASQKLLPDLRTRLREYSQGLPWLLKKLADHLLSELRRGATQQQLLAESLNVQGLFEADLAELEPQQQEALRHIARYAPLPASEVTERYNPELIQSLVNRRLIVQVGDRLDTYWDTFRDFLNTNRVALQDSYVLRQTPKTVAKLLPLVIAAGGSAGVAELGDALGTTDKGIFNLSRELRLLGVTKHESNRVTLVDEVLAATDKEQEVRRRVATALRRHRAYSALRGLAERSGGSTNLLAYSQELRAAFPAVAVADSTWRVYARAFLFWMNYAGLAVERGSDYMPTPDATEPAPFRLLDAPSPIRTRPTVPLEAPRRALELLGRLAAGDDVLLSALSRKDRDAIRTLVALSAVAVDNSGVARVATPALVDRGVVVPWVLASLLAAVPGGQTGLEVLTDDPSANPRLVGEAIRGAANAVWSSETTRSIGGYFRGWAKAAGLPISAVSRRTSSLDAGQDTLL